MIEFYINENGIACVPLKMYNDSLEEIERLTKELELERQIKKEAINYIKEESWFCYKDNEEVIDRTPIEKLLEILGDNDENI
ncbi:MAG: hypothetical protein IKE91_06180 [Clostridia bacterium]|nr:hypothetical protein [bacterium]MBR2705036.1 hypothetical protein [Clostridia bacterium]